MKLGTYLKSSGKQISRFTVKSQVLTRVTIQKIRFITVSNSNTPFFFRKKTFLFVIRSLRYSSYLTDTSCVCQVAGVSKRLDNFYFWHPMLLIEINSVSNMECQKLKLSGYLTNTWCVCQVSFFSAHLDNKQKSFFPKIKSAS